MNRNLVVNEMAIIPYSMALAVGILLIGGTLIYLLKNILYPFFGILLNPVFAAAAMAMSSVSVVSNSLRLRRTAVFRSA